MLSIIGALVGLLGSFIPELLKFFNNKEDHKHEIAVLEIQAKLQLAEHQYRLEEINTEADIKTEQAVYQAAEQKLTGVKIIDAIVSLYNSSVRPTITYAFMVLYAYVKYSMIYSAVMAGGKWQEIGALIWNAEDFAIFSTIMGFWFGGRFMKYALEKTGVFTNGNGKTRK